MIYFFFVVQADFPQHVLPNLNDSCCLQVKFHQRKNYHLHHALKRLQYQVISVTNEQECAHEQRYKNKGGAAYIKPSLHTSTVEHNPNRRHDKLLTCILLYQRISKKAADIKHSGLDVFNSHAAVYNSLYRIVEHITEFSENQCCPCTCQKARSISVFRILSFKPATCLMYTAWWQQQAVVVQSRECT